MAAAGNACEDRTVSVVAIVLAAGRATRMGRQKVLLDLQGRSLVQRAVDAALGSRAAETVVVVGHEAGAVMASLAGRPVAAVINREFSEGMSTSLRAGVRAVGDCDAVIVMLADQPFVTSALLDRLIDRFEESGRAIVRPLAGARPANPVLLGSVLFAEILEQRGDVGGREIVERHPDEISLVPVDDPSITVDIDSPRDYAAAKEGL